MKNIFYVHGASSTPLTFNYVKQNLPEHNAINFTYNSNDKIESTVKLLGAKIKEIEGEINIVSHSLGGLIAIGASYDYHPTILAPLKIVTVSAPFSGSKIATYLKWLYPGYGLFNNISMSNPLVLEIQKRGAVEPTLNIVTGGGDSPLIKEDNDGVVSVSSQLSLTGCLQKIYTLSHFEVMLSPEIVKEIENFIWYENRKETNQDQ